MKEFDIFKNPNVEEYNAITEAVKLNEDYCPCMPEKNEDTKCMCKFFRESTETNYCHCGRFYKVKNYETVALVGDTSSYREQEDYINWYEMLMHQDFIVIGIPLNPFNYEIGSENFINMCRAITAKADALVVVSDNKDLQSIVDDMCSWAESLGKKVLTKEDLRK